MEKLNIIIQKENGYFEHSFCYEAEQSFLYLNWLYNNNKYLINYCSLEELKTATLNKSNVYVGTIEFMKLAFKKNNILIPEPLNISKNLNEFCGRKIWSGTLKDIPEKETVFIKPLNDIKLFTGCVVKKTTDFRLLLPEIKEDTQLLFSEVINFKSEWRCFVHKNKFVDAKHYAGDFRIFPNISTINRCIEKFSKEAPVSYCIDFGVATNMTHEETLLIELNDFFSCGTYGFSGENYANMLVDRFREIIITTA